MSLQNVDDVYPLSPMQEGMLFHTISEPGSGVFIEQIVSTLTGNVDRMRFERAWDRLTSRHTCLRTAFLWDGLDEPLQVVRTQVGTPWIHEDWTEVAANEQRERLAGLLASDRQTDFDPAQAPLSRMLLIRESLDDWRWIWTFHHMLCDGWSTQLLLREFRDIYAVEGAASSPPLTVPIPFRNYIEWLGQQDQSAAEQYWRRTLAGFETPTTLTVTGRPGLESPACARQERALPESSGAQLVDFARRHRLTLNTLIQGAWAILLSRYSRTDDVVFGVTVSGRPAELDGIETATGLFINTLPTRISTNGNIRLVDWLADLQKSQRELRRYEHSRLTDIQKWSDVQAGESLFETIVVFENYPDPDDTGDGEFTITGTEFHEQSNFPLALLVVPNVPITLIAIHDSDRFDATTVSGLLGHLEQILLQFPKSAALPPASLSTVTPREAEQQLRLFNKPALRRDERCLHQLIEAQADRFPDAVAVVCGSIKVTYGDLSQRATAFAHELIRAGAGVGQRVGIFAERSVEMVVGILAILKSGAAYVPLDPRWPQARLELVVADAGIRILACQSSLQDRATQAGGRAVRLPTESVPEAGRLPMIQVTPDDPAYVIYTSGSTGRPKGVAVSHCNIVHSTLARDEFYEEPPSRFLLLSSIAFDSSMVGLFWTLGTGGTLVLPPQLAERDTHAVIRLVETHRVTHTLCLPSLYELIMKDAEPARLESLQLVIVAGETCPARIGRTHLDKLPQVALFNEYGPTEATVWATAHRLGDADERSVPIGNPVASARVYVLDQSQHLCPIGVSGEIFIGGVCVATGYLNRAELSARHFIADPFVPGSRMYRTGDLGCYRDDGSLLFHGRADQQVKIRGHRIEPTEIEHVLRSRPGISDVAVVVKRVLGEIDPKPEEIADLLSELPPDEADALLASVEQMDESKIEHFLAETVR